MLRMFKIIICISVSVGIPYLESIYSAIKLCTIPTKQYTGYNIMIVLIDGKECSD